MCGLVPLCVLAFVSKMGQFSLADSAVSNIGGVCLFYFFFKGEKGFVQWPRCVLSELQLSVFKYATWSEQGLKRPCWIPWGYFLHCVLAVCSSSWIRFIAETLNLHYTWQPYSPAVLVPHHPQPFFYYFNILFLPFP